jgi:hypothetical protein
VQGGERRQQSEREEQCGREVNHSFSPYLSTAPRTCGAALSIRYPVCAAMMFLIRSAVNRAAAEMFPGRSIPLGALQALDFAAVSP